MRRNELTKLHLALFVYGGKYLDICATVVLPNLVALIGELPDDVRALTELRVLTDPPGRARLESAPALDRIRGLVGVKIDDTMEYGGQDLYGGYGPMVLGQSRLVHEASRQRAGIIFCPPDLVWSRGAFATIVRRANEGYRAVIGPSGRGIEEELVPIFRDRILVGGDERLDIGAIELTALLFDHWQKMNDVFIWNAPLSAVWKSYAYWRVGPRALLMKCWQGPALFLWPYREVKNYDGWIDHRLIEDCVHDQSEIYVVPDAQEIQTLDLAPRARDEGHALRSEPSQRLFRQLLNTKRHCMYNVLYGRRSIRIYDTPVAEDVWRDAAREFDRQTRPAMYAALVLRPALRLVERAWHDTGLAGGVRQLRRRMQIRTRVADAVRRGWQESRTQLVNAGRRLRGRLQIRTRLVRAIRATGLRPRTRLVAARRRLRDMLQRSR